MEEGFHGMVSKAVDGKLLGLVACWCVCLVAQKSQYDLQPVLALYLLP